MSNHPILDEFTHLRISRQRKYQLRKRRDHCCTECGKPAVEYSGRCLKHLVIARERTRRINKRKKRYTNTLSYQQERLHAGIR